MITQVSSVNPCVIPIHKDPRRKAQSIQFKRDSEVVPRSSYAEEYERQQKNALFASAVIIVGAVMGTIGYFMVSSLRSIRH